MNNSANNIFELTKAPNEDDKDEEKKEKKTLYSVFNSR
jgi:hypothetical protein